MLSSIAVLGRGAARVATQRAPARAASTLSGSSMSGGDSAGFSIQGEGREGRPAYLDVQVCVKIPPPPFLRPLPPACCIVSAVCLLHGIAAQNCGVE